MSILDENTTDALTENMYDAIIRSFSNPNKILLVECRDGDQMIYRRVIIDSCHMPDNCASNTPVKKECFKINMLTENMSDVISIVDVDYVERVFGREVLYNSIARPEYYVQSIRIFVVDKPTLNTRHNCGENKEHTLENMWNGIDVLAVSIPYKDCIRNFIKITEKS